MQSAGSRARHRTPERPRRLRPLVDLIAEGLLLAFAFGLMMCACQETLNRHDWFWLGFFTGSSVTCVSLYAMIVSAIIRWID